MSTQAILVMAIKANLAGLAGQVISAVRPVKIIMTYYAFADCDGTMDPRLGINPVVAHVAQGTLRIPEFMGHVRDLKIAIPTVIRALNRLLIRGLSRFYKIVRLIFEKQFPRRP
jgi:hypothetical protein